MYKLVQKETFEADGTEEALRKVGQHVRQLSLRLPQDIVDYTRETDKENSKVRLTVSWYWKERV